jgi:hypothetical protein
MSGGVKHNNACDFRFFLRRVHLLKSLSNNSRITENHFACYSDKYMVIDDWSYAALCRPQKKTNKQANKYFLSPHLVVEGSNPN